MPTLYRVWRAFHWLNIKSHTLHGEALYDDIILRADDDLIILCDRKRLIGAEFSASGTPVRRCA